MSADAGDAGGSAGATPPPLPPLERHVKGARPVLHPQQPAIDSLVAMVLALTSEVSVLADRLATVETLAGLSAEQIDAYRPGPAERAAREARREALIDRVLAILDEQLSDLRRGETQAAYWEAVGAIERGDV
jgi:hypothetical protein